MTSRPDDNPPEQLWLIPGQGERSVAPVADVAVRRKAARLTACSVPANLVAQVRPGVAVRIPDRRRGKLLDGWVVRVSDLPWDQTRPPIVEVSDARPLLGPPLLELALWLADYYVDSPARAIEAMVPRVARADAGRRVRFVRATGKATDRPLSPRRAALLERLGAEEMPLKRLLAEPGASTAVVAALRRAGLVEVLVRRVHEAARESPDEAAAADEREPAGAPQPEDDFELTPAQQRAVERACEAAAAAAFRVLLLFGVPGSGKTEVYVRTIRRVVAAGRPAILLVPEVALATQLVQRLARRFQRVAVLHGRLTPRTRADTLRRIADGHVDVVIGTRSAVFAPLDRLGLIVVDEEQESSYKNLAAPYFHARDVAIKRGQIEGVPVLLGSATPALETWHNAHHLPHYEILRLPERVPGATIPQATLVGPGEMDASREARSGRILSPALLRELAATLAAGRQAVLLHNRRGYSTSLRCEQCGLLVRCVRCGAVLVYHRREAQMRCHRCQQRSPVPHTCPDTSCGGRLEAGALAIQRLEEELAAALPQARVLRVDRDTMRHRDDYAAALGRFEAGDADVLIGTQMVAKGLDFPRVRLVGVIDADAALTLPHFRAAEQTFQLTMQVVGRAGRREGESLALIQCRGADTQVIRQAMEMNYEGFAAEELAIRRELGYPPFGRLVRLLCLDSRPGRARVESQKLADRLRESAGRISAELVIGEGEPCVLSRLREMWRFQVLIRGGRAGAAQRLLLDPQVRKVLRPRVQRFTIDVDPLDLL